jgi:hypothetical protein
MSSCQKDETGRRIKKVSRYHIMLFALPVLSLLFYGWLRAPELNERADNPQRVAALHRRGRILDRSGKPLAYVENDRRVYPQGESSGSLVGYQLRGRNHTGLEAVLQDRLSPPLPAATLSAAVQQDHDLSKGQRQRLTGPDVKLTIDSDLQKRLYELMQPYSGAIVVADSRGEILAAVSSPSFDPNEVRENWQMLRSDARSPFIERVGSGLYPVTTSDGQPLLSQAQLTNHVWFQDGGFPGYPLSSPATPLEDRILLTPLMLLHYAFELSRVHPVPQLTVLLEDIQATPGTEKPDLSLPELTPSIELSDLTAWNLGGPPFHDSPEFLVCLGNSRKQFFFAIVLEEAGESAHHTILQRLLSEIAANARS